MTPDPATPGLGDTAATVPTIDSAEAARSTLAELTTHHDWVSVFWDRGWGDSGRAPAEISVIVDGNGQQPKAWLTPEVYRELVTDGTVAENSLKTFKARRVHDFKAPPEPEPTVTPGDVAETVIRDLIAARPGAPLLAEFYRGLDPDSTLPRIRRETITTDACGEGWFVRMLPGDHDVAVSAAGAPGFLGPDLIDAAECLQYPQTTDGEVDVAALLREDFRTRLRSVVDAKLAVIDTERVARGLTPLGGEL